VGKVFAGMAASLDGYIAVASGDLSWLNDSMAPGEDYGFEQTMKRTGAYIIGANTYRAMLKSGMAGGTAINTYVVTHQPSIDKAGNGVNLYNGDLRSLVAKIKSETDKDICLFGGADLLTQFINLDLVDEIGISILPILLGEGIPFFGKINEWKRLTLFECKQFKSGIVVLNYHLKEG
jgi:dihydrofolate reductase